MTEDIVIVTPHPDDETLGCGGTILKHIEEGNNVHWLIITEMGENFPSNKKFERQQEIIKVSKEYNFQSVHNLHFEAANLDQIADRDLIREISKVFNKIEPTTVYLPYPGDIHSDHKKVFDCTIACTKWFRYSYIKKILCYETLSETDFTISPDSNNFRANLFVNIENYLEKKIEIMNIYKSEIKKFPFPRSEKSIKALAYTRGAASGFQAAEAFMVLKERIL